MPTGCPRRSDGSSSRPARVRRAPACPRATSPRARAPAFELPDVDGKLHALSEWSGKKKALVTFSSWCGCRYDLPGWQALHDELSPQGFTVVAVAIDQSGDEVRA